MSTSTQLTDILASLYLLSMDDLDTVISQAKAELSRKKAQRLCKLCGTPFVRQFRNNSQRYCSAVCANKVQLKGKNEWWRKHGTANRDKIRTPEQIARLSAKRAARACAKSMKGMIL